MTFNDNTGFAPRVVIGDTNIVCDARPSLSFISHARYQVVVSGRLSSHDVQQRSFTDCSSIGLFDKVVAIRLSASF